MGSREACRRPTCNAPKRLQRGCRHLRRGRSVRSPVQTVESLCTTRLELAVPRLELTESAVMYYPRLRRIPPVDSSLQISIDDSAGYSSRARSNAPADRSRSIARSSAKCRATPRRIDRRAVTRWLQPNSVTRECDAERWSFPHLGCEPLPVSLQPTTGTERFHGGGSSQPREPAVLTDSELADNASRYPSPLGQQINPRGGQRATESRSALRTMLPLGFVPRFRDWRLRKSSSPQRRPELHTSNPLAPTCRSDVDCVASHAHAANVRRELRTKRTTAAQGRDRARRQTRFHPRWDDAATTRSWTRNTRSWLTVAASRTTRLNESRNLRFSLANRVSAGQTHYHVACSTARSSYALDN